MKQNIYNLLIGGACALAACSAWAEDLEGRIESVNSSDQSFVVQGITFYPTPSTDYEDGLRSFADLAPGQKVEIDFASLDGKHYATEIELED